MTFTEAKIEFDNKYGNCSDFNCFLPEHLTIGKVTSFKKRDGSKKEQYYKWQFLYSIVNSGLFPIDFIGTEINFPKGNKSSANIKLDGAIFSDSSWYDKYKDYHQNNNTESLDWLRKNLIVALEFKKEDNKNVSEVWDKQLKADGYQIYRSASGKSGSYKKISTLRSPDKNSYTNTGLKNAKTYYYAVRAFCRIGGKEYFGKFAKASLSTRLTKSYLQKRLVAANKFYIDWIQHRFEAHACEDPSDTRPVPGDNYGFIYIHVKSDKYKSVADLKRKRQSILQNPFMMS